MSQKDCANIGLSQDMTTEDCSLQVRMYCGSETVDRIASGQQQQRMQWAPGGRCVCTQ